MNISKIKKLLTTKVLGRNMSFYNDIDSTSTSLKNMWMHLPDGYTVSANAQHSGRGRVGKTFYSPKDTGLYFSFLMKQQKNISDTLFTVKMSYAVLKAIDEVTETQSAGIKWVNDIYAGNKKIAGILCESVHDETENAVIAGVGINLSLDKPAVPQELKGKIGSIRDITKKKTDKEKLLAEILNYAEKVFDGSISEVDIIYEYRQRSVILGREINVLKQDTTLRAAALDIADDGGLVVRYENGICEKLTAGEVSIVI